MSGRVAKTSKNARETVAMRVRTGAAPPITETTPDVYSASPAKLRL